MAEELMPDNFKVEDCLGFIANRLVRGFQKSFDGLLNGYGLTSAQFCVLAKLYEKEGLTQTELASRLFIESPTLVRTLDRMETADFIERRRAPGDRRAYHIYLLPKGQALRDVVNLVGREINEKATRSMADKEVESLRRYLRVIWDNLELG
jgi:DNA-binding MarR family transcriptional regulator